MLVHNASGYKEKGAYSEIKGHHIFAKAAFRGEENYNYRKAFSISQKFMEDNNLNHSKITVAQRKLFRELFKSGRENTLREQINIAKYSLRAGGASKKLANQLVTEAFKDLLEQEVSGPTRIPWYTK